MKWGCRDAMLCVFLFTAIVIGRGEASRLNGLFLAFITNSLPHRGKMFVEKKVLVASAP
jgi:hypothetical protein